MSYIQQYGDLELSFVPYYGAHSGTLIPQGLVQNVTISADAGLDSVNYISGTQTYIKDRTATVSFETILGSGNSVFANLTGHWLVTGLGDIYFSQRGGLAQSSLRVQDCLLSSVEYNLTSDSFFTAKYEYTALGITGSSLTSSYLPDPTGSVAWYRTAYDGGNSKIPISGISYSGTYAINISFNIERKNLYNKANPEPQYSVMVLPINTSFSFETYAPGYFDIYDPSGIFLKGQPLNDQIVTYFSKIQDCDMNFKGNTFTIALCSEVMSLYDLYLSSFETQGGGVDGTPLSFKVTYESKYDYRLIENGGTVVNYVPIADGGGGGGPPPEPE